MKKCPKCGNLLEDSNFYIQKSGRHKGKLSSWCKSCCSKKSSERYKNNKEECNRAHREWVQKNKDKVAFTKAKSAYGISKEEYDSLIRKCQICGSEENLVIDHSHQSGRIRGMLCSNCNKGLGFFKDNPALLQRASDYVLGVHETVKQDIFKQTYEQAGEQND